MKQRGEIVRRQAEQHAERVERLLELDLELGDRRFGVREERRRLLHLDIGKFAFLPLAPPWGTQHTLPGGGAQVVGRGLFA